jgi:hypothetical protein
MANQLKTILILFISAFLILTISKGVILCFEFFFPSPEYTFYGYDRSFSSVFSLLFAGFRNSRSVLESVIVAIPFVFSILQFFGNDVLKNRRRSVLTYAIFTSLFLAALWFVKEILFLITKGENEVWVQWNIIKDEFIIVLTLSFLVYLSLLFPLSKQIFKTRSTQ